MHSLPGGGKSTCSKAIAKKAEDLNRRCEVFSTDDFWMKDGKYIFDANRLKEAHRWNRHLVLISLNIVEPDFIVVDNTNLTYDECEPYIEAAFLKNYDVIFVEPATSWRNNVEECFKRNTHGVPLETLKKMVSRKEDVRSMVKKARDLADKIAYSNARVDSLEL